ncbi:USP6 N-terminal-like protein [Rhizoclosmatium hyalinum]|nr:USP6 N-terminal-like protein [Rhizoclosmatium hyalinum]
MMMVVTLCFTLLSTFVLAYTLIRLLSYVFGVCEVFDERSYFRNRFIQAEKDHFMRNQVNQDTILQTTAQESTNEQETLIENESTSGTWGDDEMEEDTVHNQAGNTTVVPNPTMPVPPQLNALPPPPAPLLRRDSGQSDDHDMNCLHFFALSNEHVDHISDLVSAEFSSQRDYDKRRTLHRSHVQNLNFSMKSNVTRFTQSGTPLYPAARKQIYHTHVDVVTHNNPSNVAAVTTTRIATATQTLLAPAMPSLRTPPVRSVQLDINARVKFHCLSPLHFAAMNASLEFISALIRNGANINSTDIHCRTPLRLATNSRRPEIVRFLLKYPECLDLPDAEGTTALRSAVFRSDVEIVRAFLQARPSFAHMPLEGGSDGSDGDKSSGIHALHVCASFGNLEMINMLVHDIRVNIDARDALGRTPLMYAATKGKWEAVEHLLTLPKAPEIESTSRNPGLERREESSLTLVGEDETSSNNCKELSSKSPARADPNAQDRHGWTALHYAAVATKADPLKTIEVLAAHGAVIDAKEFRYALTPLHMAAKSGHVNILNLLIKKGANPNYRTTDNRTCLCFAAYGSHIECINALIASNPEVVRPTVQRQKRDINMLEKVARVFLDVPFMATRLVWSITFGYRPILLIDSGLYHPVSASSTLSPLHLAIRAKDQSHGVIDILLEAGVDINAGIPIEVGSEWFAFCKRVVKRIAFLNQPDSDEEDDKIFHVNPVCFALAFGNGDIALRLLQHPTQYFRCGVVVEALKLVR